MIGDVVIRMLLIWLCTLCESSLYGNINGIHGDLDSAEILKALGNHCPDLALNVYKGLAAFVHAISSRRTINPPVLRGLFPRLSKGAYFDDLFRQT